MSNDTTDRELLELAAKAAGGASLGQMSDDGMYPFGGEARWNPLTDDGDGARLEAALGVHVVWHTTFVNVGGEREYYADHNGDRQAARRRASVRAAAEIGKALP